MNDHVAPWIPLLASADENTVSIISSFVAENPLTPILLLLAVVAFVIYRLPKIELGHSPKFRRRRVLNWLPLGLTYSLLYMGRYNLNVSKAADRKSVV